MTIDPNKLTATEAVMQIPPHSLFAFAKEHNLLISMLYYPKDIGSEWWMRICQPDFTQDTIREGSNPHEVAKRLLDDWSVDHLNPAAPMPTETDDEEIVDAEDDDSDYGDATDWGT